MNKTIIININSIVFHIEEDAYEILRHYMIDIKKHFGRTTDSDEILQDIENRIAEMFSERIQAGKKEVISSLDVEEVIAQMGRVSDFEEVDDFSDTGDTDNKQQKEEKSSFFGHKKMMRNPDDMIIGGVCSGLAYYLGIQVKWIRILFVLFFLFGGSGVLLYVVLWVLMPLASSRADRMAMRGEEPNLQNFKKSLEDGVEQYKEGFNQAKGFMSKGVQAVGDAVSIIFRFIGKFFALLLLVFSGVAILGLIFLLVAFSLGVMGYQDNIVFPPLAYLSKEQGLIALLAGVLALIIPFIALFHLFLRILFRTAPMNTYICLSLWATWIVSIIMVVVYSLVGVQDFKEISTIKVEKPLQAQTIYRFAERDLRVIEASTLENGQKDYQVNTNAENFSSLIREEITVRFEQLDSLASPYIQYNYTAQGKTYQHAAERAAKIDYEIKEGKNKLIFDSHFKLGPTDLYRGQKVAVVVFLPLGSKVIIAEALQDKLRGISYWSCHDQADKNENGKETSWIMQKSGLACN